MNDAHSINRYFRYTAFITASFVVPAALAGCSHNEAPPASNPENGATTTSAPEAASAPAAAADSTPAPAPTPSAEPKQASLPQPILVPGMSTPESVLYDSEADVYLVSNIVGSPNAVDDNGYIAKISPDGSVIDAKWIDGAKPNVKLNAPKGMAISGGTLYVSDITEVRKFDAKTGAPKGSIPIKGSTFLNDVAADSAGNVYVSDSGVKAGAKGFEPTGTDALYEIVKDKPKSLIKGSDLKGPNGILIDGSDVWIVTLTGNELYSVRDGKKANVTQLPKGTLDGIVKTPDGQLLITSWEGSQIFKGSASQGFTPVISDVKGPADIGYDSKRNRVLIPLFLDNAVRIQPL